MNNYKKYLGVLLASTIFIGCGSQPSQSVKTPNKNVTKKDVSQLSRKEQIRFVKQDFNNINYTSKEFRLSVLKTEWEIMKYIKNPSIEEQVTAIRTSPFAVKHIKKPSKEARREVLKYFGQANLLSNLTEEEQILAIKRGGNLDVIKNPTEKVQLALENLDSYNTQIKNIENPTEKVQFISVKKDARNIRYIKNPTKKVQEFVIKKNPEYIRYINNPTENIQYYALTKGIDNIEYIKKPTEKIQLIAVSRNPEFIKYIKNPTERVELYVLNKSIEYKRYIKKPSLKAQLFMYDKNKYNLDYLNTMSSSTLKNLQKIRTEMPYVNMKKGLFEDVTSIEDVKKRYLFAKDLGDRFFVDQCIPADKIKTMNVIVYKDNTLSLDITLKGSKDKKTVITNNKNPNLQKRNLLKGKDAVKVLRDIYFPLVEFESGYRKKFGKYELLKYNGHKFTVKKVWSRSWLQKKMGMSGKGPLSQKKKVDEIEYISKNGKSLRASDFYFLYDRKFGDTYSMRDGLLYLADNTIKAASSTIDFFQGKTFCKD